MRTRKGPTSQRKVWLGETIREIRNRKGLTLEEVSERISPYYSEGSAIRRLEAGKRWPKNREHLVMLLVRGLGFRDLERLNQILIEAGFDKVDMDEQSKYKLQQDIPATAPYSQLVRWAPTDGGVAGIFINSVGGPFIPWAELKQEIEKRLLPKVAKIPPGSTVRSQEHEKHRDFVVRIVSVEGKEVGSVWFGPDPYKKWAWDGLVRVGWAKSAGAPETVVWHVTQRYSDGSYLTLEAYD